jgi:Zn-dependent peptidase ImmA (M78 family)
MKWVRDKTGRFAQRPHYLPDELDIECERVILAFLNKKYGKVEFPIKTDDLTVLIEEQADLDGYANLSGEGQGVEGMTEFQSDKRPLVKITDGLNAPHLENRLRTTLTHEYGHVHFHRFLFEEPPGRPDSLFGAPRIAQGNKCHRDTIIAASERDWMEWQAGYACGALLMPVGALMDTVQRFRQDHLLPYTNLSLQSDDGRKLITTVAADFQTSSDAARVRLLKKGILLDMGRQATESLF